MTPVIAFPAPAVGSMTTTGQPAIPMQVPAVGVPAVPDACRDLASAPNILDRLVEDLHRSGLRGEDRAAKVIYLALTSRILDRPISIAVKGPSSAGKSHLVESTLKFFPASAAYKLTAMTDKVLAYSKEDLRNRFLVLFEAEGLTGKFSTYAIRSMLSEGCIRYETVERVGGQIETRLIHRPGPTGFITTTTRLGLHAENETRLLSVPVNDTPEQTRDVMRAIAEGGTAEMDFSSWHALQDWLQSCGDFVEIPFAGRLAELVSPAAIRVRRDFTTLLNLIKSHALLHRATRKISEAGAVVARVEDYAAIKDLVGDLMAEGVKASVPATVRETVQTVEDLLPENPDGVGLSVLTEALGLDKSAVSRRVKQAQEAGHLVNLQEVQGRPARLRLGEAMPEDVEILPLPETLRA